MHPALTGKARRARAGHAHAQGPVGNRPVQRPGPQARSGSVRRRPALLALRHRRLGVEINRRVGYTIADVASMASDRRDDSVVEPLISAQVQLTRKPSQGRHGHDARDDTSSRSMRTTTPTIRRPRPSTVCRPVGKVNYPHHPRSNMCSRRSDRRATLARMLAPRRRLRATQMPQCGGPGPTAQRAKTTRRAVPKKPASA